MSGSKQDQVSFRLFDAFQPTLPADHYRLTATQTLSLISEPSRAAASLDTLTVSQDFWVSAPRFSLQPDEIYSVYPANGHKGPYHQTPPHIVFRRRTLPWEVRLQVGTDGAPVPWMALLLFDETAGELSADSFKSMLVEAVPAKPGDAAKPGGVRGPLLALPPQEWETRPSQAANGPFPGQPAGAGDARPATCKVLEIAWDLFRLVTPRLDELPYLAHARHVETTYKEDTLGTADGWFSVVLANRLPAAADPHDTKPPRSVAVLVSLEGLEDLIRNDPPQVVPATVRMVVLTSWAFESADMTFEQHIRAINQSQAGDPWLRVRPAAPAEGEAHGQGGGAPESEETLDPEQKVRRALELGYVALPHNLRQGDTTVSWYRGPCIPVWVSSSTENLMIGTADEFLQYDRQTDMFNVSYAAAWQLGRLLALQTPEFARTLFHLESGSIAEAAVQIAEDGFTTRFSQPASRSRAARLQQDELMVAIALEWLE